MAAASILFAVLAAGFLALQNATGTVRVRRNRWTRSHGAGGAVAMVATLTVVAIQEEVLFRGYLTVNLIRFGWVVVAVASTLLFVAVHLIANRVSAAQVFSWSLSGLVLVLPYLLSGSIWVPIVLHLVIDLLNVIAFGIVGRYAWVTITPPLTQRATAGYRVVAGAAVAVLVLGVYGAQISSSLHPPGAAGPPSGAAR